MPGPITYAALTLLARDRLGQIVRMLRAKRDQKTASPLEKHVFYLSEQAHNILSAAEPTIEPPLRLYGPPLTDGVSRFALLGAIGPDLPRYATPFAPEQDWLFKTLHKGTPDENREKVLAHSTDLVFEIHRQVDLRINTEFADTRKREAARNNLGAYVLGHFCHVAADVFAHPYFESLEATQRVSRDAVAGGFDRQLAKDFFNRDETRSTKWADWFPPPGDVPKAFREGMAAAIVNLYGARPPGLPAFEDAFAKVDPAPRPLDADLIGDALKNFRSFIAIERTWTFWDWFGALAPTFVPMIFAYPAALELSEAKDLTRTLDGPESEQRAATRLYEQVTYPFAVGALGPLVTMIIVSASGSGLRAEGVTAWVNAGLQLVAAIGFFSTLGGAGGARWMLFFALPLALNLFQMIFTLARGSTKNVRALLWFGPALQIFLGLVFLLLYSAFLHKGVEEWQKETDRDDLKAWGFFAIWGLIVSALWFLASLLARHLFAPSILPEPRRYLRLYDDVALVHDPNAPADSQRLEHLLYPWSRRPMLKLWWTGSGPMMRVRADHDRLVFSLTGSVDDANNKIVYAPPFPLSCDLFVAQLKTAVDHAEGKLEAKVVFETEAGLELSAGEMFSDHGDGEDEQSDHDEAAKTFKDLGADEEHAFVLYHAPRQRLAVRMGTSGPVRDAAVSGANTVFTPAPTTGVGPNDVQGSAGTVFDQMFRIGDTIVVRAPGANAGKEMRRRVVAVKDGALVGPVPGVAMPLLELDAPLDLPLAAPGVPFERAANEDAEGFAFVANENDVFGEGGSIMNDAADFAALLCLAAASRLQSKTDPAPPPGTDPALVPVPPPRRVYQIFRNWNLDRRRINEWKLLVAGGAVSERRGDFITPDEAAPIESGDEFPLSGELIDKRREGERIVRERGILPVFRAWVEMAGRPRNDVTKEEVFRPGEPTNRDLSRALAYVLDAEETATP